MKRLALAICLCLGAFGGMTFGSGHGVALASNAGGASMLVQFCQANPGIYPYTGSSQGACVSWLTSSQNSNAYAPWLCSWIATTYLGNGYGFVIVFINNPTDTLTFSAPVSNQGQCVSTINANARAGNSVYVALYP